MAEEGAFLRRVREVWEARGDDGRAELERQFEEVVGAAFSNLGWKARHDELQRRYDLSLAREIGDARTALARVTALFWDYSRRKTLPVDGLRIALSKCRMCDTRWAARTDVAGEPACEECSARLAELRTAEAHRG